MKNWSLSERFSTEHMERCKLSTLVSPVAMVTEPFHRGRIFMYHGSSVYTWAYVLVHIDSNSSVSHFPFFFSKFPLVLQPKLSLSPSYSISLSLPLLCVLSLSLSPFSSLIFHFFYISLSLSLPPTPALLLYFCFLIRCVSSNNITFRIKEVSIFCVHVTLSH